jgi:hypothetical protein
VYYSLTLSLILILREGEKMNIRGFLAVLILAAVVVYFLWVAKAGKDKVIEEVRVFDKAKHQLTETNMRSLAREIHSFIAMDGRAPKNLKELQAFRRVPLGTSDAWGIAIKYDRLTDEEFRLISAGPDREFDTEDDISKEY